MGYLHHYRSSNSSNSNRALLAGCLLWRAKADLLRLYIMAIGRCHRLLTLVRRLQLCTVLAVLCLLRKTARIAGQTQPPGSDASKRAKVRYMAVELLHRHGMNDMARTHRREAHRQDPHRVLEHSKQKAQRTGWLPRLS